MSPSDDASTLTTKRSSGSRSSRPRSWIAARCSPRARSRTSTPARRRRAAQYPPMPPAPMMPTFTGVSPLLLVHRRHLGRRLEHFHHFLDRDLELVVDPLRLLGRRVLDPHVRRNAEVLEVLAVVVRLRRIPRHDERARRANRSAVDEIVAP